LGKQSTCTTSAGLEAQDFKKKNAIIVLNELDNIKHKVILEGFYAKEEKMLPRIFVVMAVSIIARQQQNTSDKWAW